MVAKLKLRWSSWSCGGYVGDVVVMQAGLRCGSDPQGVAGFLVNYCTIKVNCSKDSDQSIGTHTLCPP